MDRIKVLFTEGDSWTSGDIIDPELDISFVNDPSNDEYRLPKVWPSKLAKILKCKSVNTSVAGSSNDGIVRRCLNKIPELLTTYKPEDILVIIGWSSPERKDFFYKNSWDTLYPAQYDTYHSSDEIKQFYNTYLNYFWKEEEYLTRYVNNVILLHNFFENLNIRHYFFDAFYERKEVGLKKTNSLYSYINTFYKKSSKSSYLRHINLDFSIPYYYNIYKSNYIEKTFKEFINKKLTDKTYFEDYHPTETSHQLWANYLYEKIDND